MLRNDQAQQFGTRETGLPAPDMSPRQADPGQDPIIQEDVKCGQEGVEFIVNTKGLTDVPHFSVTIWPPTCAGQRLVDLGGFGGAA